MPTNVQLRPFIENWAALVESENPSRKEISGGSVLCLFDGSWHDGTGNRVEVSPEQESEIVRTISRIESANYVDVPGLIMLDDAETLGDIADYLECDFSDMFIFFRKPTNGIREWESPSSKDPELAGGLYLLASLQEYRRTNWVEIADLNGSIGGIAGGKVFSGMANLLGRWISDHEVRLVAQSCREATSNKIFSSDFFRNIFRRFGFEVLDLEENDPESWTGENFFLNVLVDSEWWKGLSERDRRRVVDLIGEVV